MTAPSTSAVHACVLTAESASASGAHLATTGLELLPAILVGGVLLAIGAGLVVTAMRRDRATRRTDDRGSRGAVVAALLVLVLGAALAVGTASPAHATEQVDCDLISYSVDALQQDAVIGGGGVETERLTVRNVTDGIIELGLSTRVLDDADGLAPYVRVTAGCGCSDVALIDGVLSQIRGAGHLVRLAPGQAVAVAVRAATTPEIVDSLQGTRLAYALIAHAAEVGA